MQARTALPVFFSAIVGTACAGAAPEAASPSTASTLPPEATAQPADPVDGLAAAAAAAPDGCALPDAPAELPEALLVEGRIDGCFEPASSKDAYRFTVPGTGTQRVTLVVEGARGGLSTFVDLYDAGGAKLHVASAMTNQRTPRQTLELSAEPGASIGLIAYPNTAATTSQPFTITIDAAPDGDPGEPNDTPEAAVALTSGVPVEALITGRVSTAEGTAIKDVDHYRLDVARAGQLHLLADQVVGARPRLTLLDARGKKVGSPAFEGLPGDVTLTSKVKPGTYVIAVDDINGAIQTTQVRSYRLTATVR